MNKTLLQIVANAEINRINGERANFSRADNWINAIGEAARNLSNGITHTWRNGELIIVSTDNQGIYVATRDTCTCPAYTLGEGKPCKHRASWTLVFKMRLIERVFGFNGEGAATIERYADEYLPN